jgi:hypothetical protein
VNLLRMTYSRVNGDSAPAVSSLRPLEAGVEAFLGEHVAELLKLGAQGDTAPAHFIEDGLADLFADLESGTDEGFLNAASTLTSRVHERMDGRTSPGLLLCATMEHAGTRHATVLKLRVVAEQGAVLARLDSGEEVLSAVTDVLERPGELQKGVVTPDARVSSEAILTDKLGVTSLYFPEALGLRQEQKGDAALASLLTAIASHNPAAAESAAEHMPQVTSQTIVGVLTELGNHIPALTAEVQQQVVEQLSNQPRPVLSIDSQRPVRGVVTAGTLKITGPFASVRNIDWSRDPESDDWIITVRADAPPERKFK